MKALTSLNQPVYSANTGEPLKDGGTGQEVTIRSALLNLFDNSPVYSVKNARITQSVIDKIKAAPTNDSVEVENEEFNVAWLVVQRQLDSMPGALARALCTQTFAEIKDD